jgi:acyl carrier protein
MSESAAYHAGGPRQRLYDERNPVTRLELYQTLDDILEIPAGSIKGDEVLSSLKNWDSLSVVSYIATCNGLFGVVLEGERVKACATVQDLVELVRDHVAG